MWRFMNINERFRTFGMNRVMFGDRSAAVVTAVAMRQTTEIHKSVNEEDAKKIMMMIPMLMLLLLVLILKMKFLSSSVICMQE